MLEERGRDGKSGRLMRLRQRRFAAHVFDDDHPLLRDDGTEPARVFERQGQGRGKVGQVGKLVGRHLQPTVFLERVDGRAAVRDDRGDLVEDQVEERFEFEGGGDALGNFEDGGKFARAVADGLFQVLIGLRPLGHVGGDDEEAAALLRADGGVMLADAAEFSVGTADPVLQFGRGFSREQGVDSGGFFGGGEIADALAQVAFGTFAEDLADALVHVDHLSIFDDGQSLLDVVGQVAEALLVESGGILGLLMPRDLEGEFHVQARQFALVEAGALFEFAVELEQVGLDFFGGRERPGENRGQPKVKEETERGGENPQQAK